MLKNIQFVNWNGNPKIKYAREIHYYLPVKCFLTKVRGASVVSKININLSAKKTFSGFGVYFITTLLSGFTRKRKQKQLDPAQPTGIVESSQSLRSFN